MVYSLKYRRPAQVPPQKTPKYGQFHVEGASRGSVGATVQGVPTALSFHHVVTEQTYAPCTLRDFMNYLIYIEYAAENLQFYLWFQYYTRRFSELPPSEQILSQPWNPDKGAAASRSQVALKSKSSAQVNVNEVFKSMDSDDEHARPGTVPAFEDGRSVAGTDNASTIGTTRQDMERAAAVGYAQANVKLQPFTIQPFREEITRVIATYLTDDAPRQLNLSSRDRNNVLKALSRTTHPTAFQDVICEVEWTLRQQSHPNFIRWVISNCNGARLRFCGALGGTLLTAGLICLIILTLSHANRAWRVIAMLPMGLGIAMIFMVNSGVCLVLHLLHHRHLKPWELFLDDERDSIAELKSRSMETLGSSNSFENEPWISRYKRRNLIRKIFDREEYIKDPRLRGIHNTIFIQALIIGFTIGGIIAGVFCAIPQLHFL